MNQTIKILIPSNNPTFKNVSKKEGYMFKGTHCGIAFIINLEHL